MVSSLLVALMATADASSRAAEPCSVVVMYENGAPVGTACEDAPGADHVVLDLGDDWAPHLFLETPELPLAYRQTFVALANERPGEGNEWRTARHDRFYELFGIFPSFSVIRRRLLDEPRHACHLAIDDAPLRSVKRTLAPWISPVKPEAKAAMAAALEVVQAHLRCEGLLPTGARTGAFDEATKEGLSLYQRRQMTPSTLLDAETRDTLLTSSRELDFRMLLRALRERVVDATGLIEDGSARNAWEPILGRFIDSEEYRNPLRRPPLENGAPDLVARATALAAQGLGWTSPEAAARRLAAAPARRVVVRRPPDPAYHERGLRLRVEIDRGDVWTSYPFDADGEPRKSPVKYRPTLTVFAQTAAGDVALVRWPTTIGAWKQEEVSEGRESLRYKPSPSGRAYWRDLVVAPTWLPFPTIPDRELVRRLPDGTWDLDHDALGPGYRSAYGLVALYHHPVKPAGGVDPVIRTHGSGNYRSILRGSSHGCHRLFNHLAIRLGSFLLAHGEPVRHGPATVGYGRLVRWKGATFHLRADSRGYRYELVPPVQVDVLPGRTVRSRSAPSVPLARDLLGPAAGSP